MEYALMERAEHPWGDDERKDRDRGGDDQVGGDYTLKAEHRGSTRHESMSRSTLEAGGTHRIP